MDNQNKAEVNEMYRVEKQNKLQMFAAIQESQGPDIEIYKDAFRRLYFEEQIFKSKKSREMLERTLQEFNPELHYTEQSEHILKNIAKVYLIELFEEAVEVRAKMVHKTDIDEEIIEEANRRMKAKIVNDKF